MNERIKELRKYLHLTQDEFGQKLGIAKSTISNIEKERYSVTNQTIKLIVKEFGVNEHWLRTGESEMFPESDKTYTIVNLTTQILTEVPKSFKSRLITFLVQMPDEQCKLLEEMLYKFLRSENHE
jgi:transcriptional regulator with XRE-family HTH domain